MTSCGVLFLKCQCVVILRFLLASFLGGALSTWSLHVFLISSFRQYKMGFKHTAFSFISLAHTNIQEMFPDHNPILHHTAESARPGDSVFHDGIRTVKDALALVEKYLDNGSEWYVSCSSKKEACFTVEMPVIVGKVSNSPPLPQEEYVIVRDHYGLMPSGKAQATLEDTKKITIILTPERTNPDEEKKYVLASIYPGEPGTEGDWHGLKEGSTVRGEELLKRGVARVKQIG